MLTRQNALHVWLNKLTDNSSFRLTPIAGDASFRRYFRLHYENTSHVVMDAPPEKERLSSFVQIARALAEDGVRTPEVIAYDLTQGFALLEDFGDALLLDDTESERTTHHYQSALDTLHKMQACHTEAPALPNFDINTMGEEVQLFRTWFLERWLGLTLTHSEEHMLNDALTYLLQTILNQPTCFIHSDYHSRNLALIGPVQTPTIGVLDFQDAMIGPFTYDLVSLLKDAYVRTNAQDLKQRISYFYQGLPNNFGWSQDAFEYGFHLTGIQRHLKVLGIFCRLDQRDGKSRYLEDLPLTFTYLKDALPVDKQLLGLAEFIEHRVHPAFQEKTVS